jgi:hypothetical protein
MATKWRRGGAGRADREGVLRDRLAKGHHDIALVDELGRLVAKKPISETVDGFAELTAMLARAHQTPPGAPTKASHELRSLLREHYPSFLGAFAGKNGKHASNLATIEASAVLAIAPTPIVAANLSKTRIAAALRRAPS